MGSRVRAAIAAGSNLGDRAANLQFAFDRLSARLADLNVSSIIESAPVGVPDAQPHFLNAAVVGTTEGSARELLSVLLDIEREAGRTRPFAGAARTLDLDLIFFGQDVISEEGLTVPHPRFRSRRFVVGPLAEIAPNFIDPVSGRTVLELLRALPPIPA